MTWRWARRNAKEVHKRQQMGMRGAAKDGRRDYVAKLRVHLCGPDTAVRFAQRSEETTRASSGCQGRACYTLDLPG